MERFKLYANWSWRSWPLIMIIVIGIIHFLLYRTVGLHQPNFNKLVSTVVQIAGGGVVIYSINDNIGAFREYGLWKMFKNYLSDFPRKRRAVTLSASATAQANATATASATVTRGPRTLEQRITELEQSVENCIGLINRNQEGLLVRIEEVRQHINISSTTHAEKLKDLLARVEKIFIGGIRWQFFGFLLLIYGAVTAYFA